MTPQLQQAVRLLQMSTIELNQEIQHAHETNPLLEITEIDSSESGEPDSEQEFDAVLNEESAAMGVDSETIELSDVSSLEFDQSDQSDWDDAQNYAPIDQRRSASSSQSIDTMSADFNIPEDPSSLREVLGNQAIFLFENEVDRRIAHHLIQNINDAGYIDVPLLEIQQTLSEKENVCMHQIEDVLGTLQKLEPLGVAARNPQECLMLQLQARDKHSVGFDVACEIIRCHLDALANKEYTSLKKRLGISEKELGDAICLIQQLNPHPGYSVGDAKIDYIVPDIIVEKRKQIWFASINPKSLPKLSINQDYQELINKSIQGDYSSMKEQLAHARWLLSNLEKRHQTILSVAREIVDRQQGFFDYGAERMLPMTLNDIAEPLGIHESTVSRATSGKFLSAPQGVFELKYFFSSQIRTDQGENVSSLAIQSEIKQLVEQEPSNKPISDEKICTLLANKGYKVARRTVAKYREQMNIPSSSKRKSIQ